jgi:hypothetical protein
MATRYTTFAIKIAQADGCTVTVYDAAGALATIYADSRGTIAKPNPFPWEPGAGGSPFFFAAAGSYYTVVAGNALTLERYEVRMDAPSVVQIGAYDCRLTRAAANVLQLENMSNAQKTRIGQSSQLLSALSGATATATGIIPAGAVVLGVTTRVVTLVTGATSYAIGDGSDADRWGTGIAVAKDTVSGNADCTITSIPVYAAATNVVLTAGGSNFTAGAIRVTVHYLLPVAETS